MKRLVIILVFACIFNLCCANQIVIPFYGQHLLFEYNEDIILKKRLKPNEKHFKKFYERIVKCDYKSIINGLQFYRKELKLNDWLYYSLIDSLCGSLENHHTNSTYLKWFFMGKSGYKLQLAFSKKHISILVESDESFYNVPKFKNSYCINCGNDQNIPLHSLTRFNPYKASKGKFSFFFNPLPKFPNTNYVNKNFELKLFNSFAKEEVEIAFDSLLILCLGKIDGFNMQQTSSVPLSPNAKRLLDKIDEITRGRSDSVRVTYLMDFVAKNSSYLSDKDAFQRDNKWLAPEEFLFYGFSDCEDRSSFMFYALKELLKTSVVIVDYPSMQHVNVAVNIKLKKQPDFFYKERPYYICETTVKTGFIPLGKATMFKNEKYEIIGEYNPGADVVGTSEK